MVDKEFLYTKDLLFFNKPRTYAVTDENDKYFCFRTFVTDDYTEKVDKRLTPYEDNECKSLSSIGSHVLISNTSFI